MPQFNILILKFFWLAFPFHISHSHSHSIFKFKSLSLLFLLLLLLLFSLTRVLKWNWRGIFKRKMGNKIWDFSPNLFKISISILRFKLFRQKEREMQFRFHRHRHSYNNNNNNNNLNSFPLFSLFLCFPPILVKNKTKLLNFFYKSNQIKSNCALFSISIRFALWFQLKGQSFSLFSLHFSPKRERKTPF